MAVESGERVDFVVGDVELEDVAIGVGYLELVAYCTYTGHWKRGRRKEGRERREGKGVSKKGWRDRGTVGRNGGSVPGDSE